MARSERCCGKCRALPGTCAKKRVCPCRPSTYREDHMPDDAQPKPKEDRPPMFVRPSIAPRPARPVVSPGTSPFRA